MYTLVLVVVEGTLLQLQLSIAVHFFQGIFTRSKDFLFQEYRPPFPFFYILVARTNTNNQPFLQPAQPHTIRNGVFWKTFSPRGHARGLVSRTFFLFFPPEQWGFFDLSTVLDDPVLQRGLSRGPAPESAEGRYIYADTLNHVG